MFCTGDLRRILWKAHSVAPRNLMTCILNLKDTGFDLNVSHNLMNEKSNNLTDPIRHAYAVSYPFCYVMANLRRPTQDPAGLLQALELQRLNGPLL